MMKLVTNLFLASLILLSSCSSFRVPTTKKRAGNTIENNLRQNKAILAAYPELSDTTAMVIPGFHIDTSFIAITDTEYVDMLLAHQNMLHGELYKARVKLDKMLTGRDSNSALVILYRSKIAKLKSLKRDNRDQIIDTILVDATYTYDDSLMSAVFTIEDGVLVADIDVKDRKMDKSIQYDFTTGFWEQPKFYLFFGAFLFLLYTVLTARDRRRDKRS